MAEERHARVRAEGRQFAQHGVGEGVDTGEGGQVLASVLSRVLDRHPSDIGGEGPCEGHVEGRGAAGVREDVQRRRGHAAYDSASQGTRVRDDHRRPDRVGAPSR